MKRITRLLAISLAVLFMLPGTSLALGAANAAASKSSPFCTNLPNETRILASKMSGSQDKVAQAWAQQDQKLATDAQNVDQKVAADRQKADSDRSADFAKLEAKATTGVQKQAVQDYEAAVNNAVSARRAAYDAARQTFRNSVTSAVTSRRSTVSGQVSTFAGAVNSAISSAEASCSSNPAIGTAARQTFVSSLRSARQNFLSDRKNDDKVGQQVRQLAATRNTAFKAADQAFQNSLKAARQALVQAFGKTSI